MLVGGGNEFWFSPLIFSFRCEEIDNFQIVLSEYSHCICDLLNDSLLFSTLNWFYTERNSYVRALIPGINCCIFLSISSLTCPLSISIIFFLTGLITRGFTTGSSSPSSSSFISTSTGRSSRGGSNSKEPEEMGKCLTILDTKSYLQKSALLIKEPRLQSLFQLFPQLL